MRDAQPADSSDDDLENEPQYLKGGYPFDEHVSFNFVVYFRCSDRRKLGQSTSQAETIYLVGEEVERRLVFQWAYGTTSGKILQIWVSKDDVPNFLKAFESNMYDIFATGIAGFTSNVLLPNDNTSFDRGFSA